MGNADEAGQFLLPPSFISRNKFSVLHSTVARFVNEYCLHGCEKEKDIFVNIYQYKKILLIYKNDSNFENGFVGNQ